MDTQNPPTASRAEQGPRSAPAPSALDFQQLFNAIPDPYLLVSVDFTIVAANDAYLRGALKTREQLLGRPLFEAFPENPEDPGATGITNLRASLERVLATRAPDTMAVQKYDIVVPAGGYEERFWSPRNIPLLTPEGQVRYILHRVEDVTELVRLSQQGEREREDNAELRSRNARMEGEVIRRGQELQAANAELRAANESLARRMREQEQAEAALREKEELLRAVISSLAEGVTVQDAQGVLRLTNASAERLFGLSQPELTGRVSSDPRWGAVRPDGTPMSGEEHPPMVACAPGGPKWTR